MHISNSNRFVVDGSANHCHLSEKDAHILFDKELDNMILKPLAIAGEFATNLKVFDEKGNSYTVLYPWRSYSQLEVAMSNYYKLFGKYTQRRNSGDIEGALLLDVTCTSASIDIPVIVAAAHVHIAQMSDLEELELLDFPFDLAVKQNQSTDGLSHIHLDTDQYAAIQGL